MARDAIKGGTSTYALVIGVERLSDITDTDDRGTAFIFADGAGAAIVGPSETDDIGPVVWGSDGGNYDLIRQKEDWMELVTSDSPRHPSPGDGWQPGVSLGCLHHGQGRSGDAAEVWNQRR
ncbi:MAG: hypothetical protein V9E81_16060 [Marmoricola sp.]